MLVAKEDLETDILNHVMKNRGPEALAELLHDPKEEVRNFAAQATANLYAGRPVVMKEFQSKRTMENMINVLPRYANPHNLLINLNYVQEYMTDRYGHKLVANI
jgi:hypothetical protein